MYGEYSMTRVLTTFVASGHNYVARSLYYICDYLSKNLPGLHEQTDPNATNGSYGCKRDLFPG